MEFLSLWRKILYSQGILYIQIQLLPCNWSTRPIHSHCLSVRPHFQNKTNFKLKQCPLLARLWVWPSASLMTPCLACFAFWSLESALCVGCFVAKLIHRWLQRVHLFLLLCVQNGQKVQLTLNRHPNFCRSCSDMNDCMQRPDRGYSWLHNLWMLF